MLPALRDELAIYPGPANIAGEPSWTMHDPARNRFFRLDWLTYEILGRWSYGDPALIAQSVTASTPLSAEPDDVEGVARFLVDSELVTAGFPGASAMLADRRRQRRKGWGEWLLHNYLFVRIPLVKPDAWLERNAGRAAWLASAAFLRLTLAALLFGLWQIARQWEGFTAALVDSISLAGIIGYGATLIFVKIAHELGHGFVAKHYGCRVPTMGVAFLVLWPVAYTDTTDTWKLPDKRQRLRVACAGVATELTIAAWATALWALLPDGPLRGAAFLLATTTWVSAIVVNFNPLMRFDGYYILSDWLDIPNLHDRAFALARWHLRRVLLGLWEPPPEPLPHRTRRALIALAWVTWLYRLALYLGIAVLVYHFFVKAVGILLFAVEMWWFILRPVAAETGAWWARRGEWLGSRRARGTVWGTAALAILLLMPLPLPVDATALLSPEHTHRLFAPEAGRIDRLALGVGREVRAGEPLATIESPAAAGEASLAQARVDGLRAEIAAASVDLAQRERLLGLQADLQAAEADLASRSQRAGRLELRAPASGRIADADPDLGVGDWVAKGTLIGIVAEPGRWQAVTYLGAEDARRIAVGDSARFLAPDGSQITLRVAEIDRDAARLLPSRLYDKAAGGDVATHAGASGPEPMTTVFRIRLTTMKPLDVGSLRSWRGVVVISGRWSSIGWRYLRAAAALILREASF